MIVDTLHTTHACSTLSIAVVCGSGVYYDTLSEWYGRKGTASECFIRGLKSAAEKSYKSHGGKFSFDQFGIITLCWDHRYDKYQKELVKLLPELGFEETKTYPNKKNNTECSFFLTGVQDLLKKLEEYDKEGKKI